MVFNATPDLIVVNTNAGQTSGTTKINYSSGMGRVFLWFRVLSASGGTVTGDTWQLKDLVPPELTDCSTPDCAFAGTFSVTLKPGQVWEGRIFHQAETDPNSPSSDEEPAAQLAVVAIVKQPSAQDLIQSVERQAGGTFLWSRINSNVPTFCRVQVGKTAPVAGPDGILRLDRPLHTVFDNQVPLGHDHQLTVESVERSIMPGNEFHFLVLVTDATGNWENRTQPFTTLRRTMTIEFSRIDIVNDGVPGDGVGHFWIQVHNIDIPGGIKTVCEFGPIDISDRPDPGDEHKEHIPLSARCLPFVVQPTQVTDPGWDVALHTGGRVETTFGNDDASHGEGKIPIPEGIREDVLNRSFAIRAEPFDPDDEFTYDVKTRVTIKYVV
jgi:hypothetical protein